MWDIVAKWAISGLPMGGIRAMFRLWYANTSQFFGKFIFNYSKDTLKNKPQSPSLALPARFWLKPALRANGDKTLITPFCADFCKKTHRPVKRVGFVVSTNNACCPYLYGGF